MTETERQRVSFNSVESLPSAAKATLELICQNSEPITQEPEFETTKVSPPSEDKIEPCEVIKYFLIKRSLSGLKSIQTKYLATNKGIFLTGVVSKNS